MGNNASVKVGAHPAGKRQHPVALESKSGWSLPGESVEKDQEFQAPSGEEEPTFFDKYKMGKRLGHGTYGQVKKVRLVSNKQVVRAVKIIDIKEESTFDKEVDILRQISHKNIICFYDAYKAEDKCFMVVELCKGGELFESIVKRRGYFESDAATSASEMLSAIKYLHGVKIMHRDIKAENFLLSDATDEPTIKLIDFGFARTYLEGQFFQEMCGSPYSLAPELVDRHYNHMVDMWAFGVLMYLMMCGDYPYKGRSLPELKRKHSQPLLLKEDLSPEAKTFIQGLLQADLARRLTAREALKHPFMNLSQLSLSRQVSITSTSSFGRSCGDSNLTPMNELLPIQSAEQRTPSQQSLLMVPSAQERASSKQSIVSKASVNSNIHAAVQSAQMEIEIQRAQKIVRADVNDEDASESKHVTKGRMPKCDDSPKSDDSEEEPLAPSISFVPALPTVQIQQRRYKAAAAIQNASAALAGGFKTRSSAHKSSATSSRESTNAAGMKSKEKELTQLHPLVPRMDEPKALGAPLDKPKPSYKGSLFSIPSAKLPGQPDVKTAVESKDGRRASQAGPRSSERGHHQRHRGS
eukprot:TRINITY_DN34556_c0_g1_i1.p1 TRINITY_DN34556_c0_g1~~TRINITY_DN34556_c0_g1_i1.p1  ORF type:complete len:581 (-),score=99.17 TRINITY_DN34556_c0_g1_i1:23-1765(-)